MKYFILLLLCLPVALPSQRIIDIIDPNRMNTSLNEIDKGVEGDPYYSSDWEKGAVITLNKQEVPCDKIKFHLYHQGVEIEVNDNKAFLDQNKILGFKTFEEEGDTTNFIKFKFEDNPEQFYKTIALGKYTLLEGYKVTIKKPRRARSHYAGGGSKSQKAKFKRHKNEYVFISPSGEPKKIKLGKKKIIKLLESRDARLFKKMWNRNDYDKNSADDLGEVLSIVNNQE